MKKKQSTFGSEPRARTAPKRRTFRAIVEKIYRETDRYSNNKKTSVPRMRWAKDFALAHVRFSALEKAIDRVGYSEYFEIYNALVEMEASNSTKTENAKWLSRLTAGLVWNGLDDRCADIFVGFKDNLQNEAAGEAFTYSDIRAMLAELPFQPFEVQLIFWLGFSGGPDLLDLVFLKLDQINRETGKVTIDRDGTSTPAEFVLVKEGLDCLRDQGYEKEEIYVFPNLVYTPEEHAIEGCRKQPVDGREKKRLERARRKAKALYQDFLEAAKVAESGKTFSSARKEVVAFLLSTGAKETSVANMLGVTLRSLQRYSFPAEWQFYCIRDLRERHLAAVRHHLDGRYIISHSQVLQEMRKFARQWMESVEGILLEATQKTLACAREAFAGISRRAHEEITAHDCHQDERHGRLLGKLALTLRQITSLRETLNMTREEIAAQYDFDLFERGPASRLENRPDETLTVDFTTEFEPPVTQRSQNGDTDG